MGHVLLILCIKSGSNFIFKVCREFLLTIWTLPTGRTRKMRVPITNPIGSRAAKGFQETGERCITAADDNLIQQFFSGETAVGRCTGFLEFGISSGSIVKSNTIKAFQFGKIMLLGAFLSKNSLCKIPLLLFAVHALFKSFANISSLGEAGVLKLS